MFRRCRPVSGDPSCRQTGPPVLCVPVLQWLVPGEAGSETDLGSLQTSDQVLECCTVNRAERRASWALVKSNLSHFQAVQAGLSGPPRPSSRPGVLPGPVLGPPDPVRSRVLRWPAVWLLGPPTAAEAVQRHHEAGCVWGARGDAEVSGRHPGTGNGRFYLSTSFLWSNNRVWLFIFLSASSHEALHPDRTLHVSLRRLPPPVAALLPLFSNGELDAPLVPSSLCGCLVSRQLLRLLSGRRGAGTALAHVRQLWESPTCRLKQRTKGFKAPWVNKFACHICAFRIFYDP